MHVNELTSIALEKSTYTKPTINLVGDITFRTPEKPDLVYHPQADITPEECGMLFPLFAMIHVKQWNTFDYYSYIDSHNLMRHFKVLNRP
jgi:hypothetical protein